VPKRTQNKGGFMGCNQQTLETMQAKLGKNAWVHASVNKGQLQVGNIASIDIQKKQDKVTFFLQTPFAFTDGVWQPSLNNKIVIFKPEIVINNLPGKKTIYNIKCAGGKLQIAKELVLKEQIPNIFEVIKVLTN
jgi:hypothetical protein